MSALQSFASVATVLAASTAALGQGVIHSTVDGAEAVAKRTGRPILAVAGSKT